MADEQAQLLEIKRLALAQLIELRSQPKPTYTIDGQCVSWQSYLESLERTIDWCDRKLAAETPFEVHSHGYTL